MILVIRTHWVKFMNEHRSYMKQKNVTGVRIVLEILKEMLWRNMHSKKITKIDSLFSFERIFSVCDHLKDEETAARAYMEFIRTQELRQVMKLKKNDFNMKKNLILGEEFYRIFSCCGIFS